MTRVLGRFVSLEMALLGLCELALSFLVIYGMLAVPGVLPALVEASSAGAAHAAALDTVNSGRRAGLHHRGHGGRHRPLSAERSASSGAAC